MNRQGLIKKISDLISSWIHPMGYELVHLEALFHQQSVLRLTIDFEEFAVEGAGSADKKKMGIEDCVKVNRAISEVMDSVPELDELFNGRSYELEVSSPGTDRPLKTLNDFKRFSGSEARIQVLRPLTTEELRIEFGASNSEVHFSKQKNFVGVLSGVRDEKVILELKPFTKAHSKTKKSIGYDLDAKGSTNLKIGIPFTLITQANLECRFEDLMKERE